LQHFAQAAIARRFLAAAHALLWHGKAGTLGQLLDRLDIAQPTVVHQKPDGRPVCAAAEAVKELLVRADGKRGGLLAVKRAQAQVVLARLFQRDVTADNLYDVDPRQQIKNKALGNHDPDYPPAGPSRQRAAPNAARLSDRHPGAQSALA